ncbi:protein phosphatase [Streptomyces chumphonensis]|uniref:Protein phosphatase n=3 Tax=Streptomyces chumphonensis TaxID=1214925 RepID=A0A927IAZ8_9ACTN|nr:ADP-ribosyltransferase [Streptomyces chumphonensis]MBD3932368.1 protein phosphatase [Streptomyces chumphonensis]
MHSTFQGLSAFYTAPEAEQLFGSTRPVSDRADGFADDLEKVAGALVGFAEEARPIVARLERLKGEAQSFVDSVKDDDEWTYDEEKIETNNALVGDISAAVAEFWAAERSAANKITALVNGTRWVANDGSDGANMYGLSVEDMRRAGETPWGRMAEEDHHWYEVGHWVKSYVWDGFIVDGVWGTLTGLGGLVGLQGWETFKDSWKGLGQLATGILIIGSPLLAAATYAVAPEGARTWMKDSLNTTKEVGKSLVAWDEWGENPGRAAGLVTFNVLTTVATLGTGTAVRGASASGTAARVMNAAGRVGRVVDPMTYIGNGLSATFRGLPKLTDVTSGLADLSAVRAVELPDGTMRLPDGTTVTPGSPLPELPPGAGAVETPDGSVIAPDGTVLHPDGSVRSPGHPAEAADQAPVELSAADRAVLDGAPGAAQPEPVGVGAGQTAGDATAHAGGDVPDAPGPGSGPSGGSGSSGSDASGPVNGGGDGVDPITPAEWNKLTPDEKVAFAEAELKNDAVTFADNTEALHYGATYWNDYAEHMPRSQQDAVHDYTMEPPHSGPTYVEINGYLRGDASLGTPEVLHDIAEIDKAMNGRPVGETLTVVRGTGLGHYGMPPQAMEGKVFTDDSYMSTSLGDTAPAFSGKEAVLHLRVPKGTPALWVEKVSAFGAGERELLMGRGTRYQVTRVVMHNGQWQVYGEILPP